MPIKHKKVLSRHAQLFCRKKRKLQGEENVIERGKEGRENSKNKSATHKKQDDQPKHPHAVIHLHRSVRKEVAQDVAAVKRGDGYEIENKQQKVDQDDEVEKERYRKQRRQAFGRDARNVLCKRHRRSDRDDSVRDQMLHKQQQNQCNRSRDQVAGRPRKGDQNIVALVVLEVACSNRRRLGPTKKEPSVDQRDQWKKYRAKRV